MEYWRALTSRAGPHSGSNRSHRPNTCCAGPTSDEHTLDRESNESASKSKPKSSNPKGMTFPESHESALIECLGLSNSPSALIAPIPALSRLARASTELTGSRSRNSIAFGRSIPYNLRRVVADLPGHRIMSNPDVSVRDDVDTGLRSVRVISHLISHLLRVAKKGLNDVCFRYGFDNLAVDEDLALSVSRSAS